MGSGSDIGLTDVLGAPATVSSAENPVARACIALADGPRFAIDRNEGQDVNGSISLGPPLGLGTDNALKIGIHGSSAVGLVEVNHAGVNT